MERRTWTLLALDHAKKRVVRHKKSGAGVKDEPELGDLKQSVINLLEAQGFKRMINSDIRDAFLDSFGDQNRPQSLTESVEYGKGMDGSAEGILLAAIVCVGNAEEVGDHYVVLMKIPEESLGNRTLLFPNYVPLKEFIEAIGTQSISSYYDALPRLAETDYKRFPLPVVQLA